MSEELPNLPELPNCKVCQHEKRFVIQKEIDGGALPVNIFDNYGVPKISTTNHMKEHHREKLILYGAVDYTIRKKGIDTAEILLDYIERWVNSIKTRTDFKDSDGIKAIELFNKIQGSIVNKHEIKVTKTVDEALRDFLSEE